MNLHFPKKIMFYTWSAYTFNFSTRDKTKIIRMKEQTETNKFGQFRIKTLKFAISSLNIDRV